MDLSNLNVIDLILAIVICLSAAVGLWRGLIRGVFGIVSLVLAFFVAKQSGSILAGSLSTFLGKSAATVIIGYALTFLIAMMVFSSLTFLLQKLAAKADLGVMDKVGGMLFGILRGGVISVLIVFMLSSFALNNQAIWRDSILVPFFGKTLKIAISLWDKEYEKYLKFDEQSRPSVVLPNLEQAAYDAKQRDNLLDGILDEEIRSGKQSSSARRERKESAIQQVNNAVDRKVQEIVLEAELRSAEERRPKGLSETELVPVSTTGQIVHYSSKLINDECTGASCSEQ